MILTESDLYPILLLVAMILAYLLFVFIIKALLPYLRQRKYLIGEMDGAFSEQEYKYWKRKLRRLYLDYIPVIGRIIKKHLK